MERHGSAALLAISFVSIRRAIGFIGISLPLALAVGKVLIDGSGLQDSISAYYYTVMRDVFVGSMCAVAVFLVSSKGYGKWDTIAGVLAGVFALGVALFPTRPGPEATSSQAAIGVVHLASAAMFFLTLALTSILLFTRTYPEDTKRQRGLARLSQFLVTSTLPGRRLPPRKKARNVIYRVCGYAIVASIAAMAVLATQPETSSIKQLHPTFWLESLAVVAFGISWLVKGETLLRDKRTINRPFQAGDGRIQQSTSQG